LLLSQHNAAFLLTCLRILGAGAPCQARIEAVIASIAGTDSSQDRRVPSTVFARSLCMSAVIWAVDSGFVDAAGRDAAQAVLDQLWEMGPIRPELLGAQLRCLVGQEVDEHQCLWTCPAMRRANAGFGLSDGSLERPVLPDLAWTVAMAATDAASLAPPDGVAGAPRWVPERGARIRCRECGRVGTVVGVDADDGWTVVEHHPPLAQRANGLWELRPAAGDGPRQCRYISHREAASVD
jgi:hypothetical protein